MRTAPTPRLQPRPDWSMPTPPTPDHLPCADCEGGDGWGLYWATRAQLDDYMFEGGADDAFIDWPFGDKDSASPADLKALGFLIV